MKPFLANACVIALLMSGSAHAQEGATIYRCIGSDGVARFGHVQCSPGQRQETRGIIPPSDPLPSPSIPTQAPAAPEPAPTVPDPPPTVIVMHTPQPLYECTTPEGDRYDSDDNSGNPRWVPLWTMGRTSLLRDRRPYSGDQYAYAGTWVRDTCRTLSRNETCQRLTTKRDDMRRRFFVAQQRERDTLRVQEGDLNARLLQDCNVR